MMKDFKRETKMAMLTYGCIGTVYIGLLYIFAIFLFPNNNIAMVVNQIKVINMDLKLAIIIGFIFASVAITVFRAIKQTNSTYMTIALTLIIPTIVVLLFKNNIGIPIILMLAYFVAKGIYKITPKPKNEALKILKLIIVMISVSTLFLGIILLLNVGIDYINPFITSSTSLNFKSSNISNYFSTVKGMTYFILIFQKFDINILLIIIAVLFSSFSTKEIIKEVIEKYKPTKKEIKSIFKGTVALFFAMMILTSAVIVAYKVNEPKGMLSETLKHNSEIKNILLDENINKEAKNFKINMIFNNYYKLSQSDSGIKLTNAYYIFDISKILLEMNIEKTMGNDIQKINDFNKESLNQKRNIYIEPITEVQNNPDEIDKAINKKYAEKIIKLESKTEKTFKEVEMIIFNLILVLFVIFILIQVYEEINIAQLLKEGKKQVKKNDR